MFLWGNISTFYRTIIHLYNMLFTCIPFILLKDPKIYQFCSGQTFQNWQEKRIITVYQGNNHCIYVWVPKVTPKIWGYFAQGWASSMDPTKFCLKWRLVTISAANGPIHKGGNHVPNAVSDCDSDPFLIWKPDFTLNVNTKLFKIKAFEMRKEGRFGSWSA